MEAVNETLQGGLSHLMEAATALAKLTDEAPLLSSRSHPKPRNISDGEFAEARLSSDLVRTTTKEIFPERLHAILNDTSLSDVISWLPHGQAFVIFRPDKFTETVLPKYLPPLDSRTSTKYPSFTRKLNRWGFRQATRGPDTGAFHHPLFRRDQPSLCLDMVCQRSRDRKPRKNLPAKKRKVAQLTKESLDAMNHMDVVKQQQNTTGPPKTTTATTQGRTVHAALVSEDSQSQRSSLSEPEGAAKQQPPQVGITVDPTLAKRAIQQRNHEERMRVAKAMLYHAYLSAVQGNGV